MCGFKVQSLVPSLMQFRINILLRINEKIVLFINNTVSGVSIFTLTMLSIDRVLVISQTMKLRRKSSFRIGIMIPAIWILSILLAIPDAVSYHLVSKCI